MSTASPTPYRRRVNALLQELGIDPAVIHQRGLQLHPEAQRLMPVGLGTDGRDKFLAANAGRAWLAMQSQAQRDGVQLLLISGFRSLAFQAALIRDKLRRGMPLAQVLKINAPPGYSEHHTGCAIDLGTPGTDALDAAFENTAAFAWLHRHAADFGFVMSYPRDNAEGYLYEPWHWCWRR